MLVRVELPTGSSVHGDLAAGDVQSSGALGECRLKTSVGHLRLDRTDGEVAALHGIAAVRPALNLPAAR